VFYRFDTWTNQNRLIVQWNNVNVYTLAGLYNPEQAFTFQLWLLEKGDILFHYLKTPVDLSTTMLTDNITYPHLIGLENTVLIYDDEINPQTYAYDPVRIDYARILSTHGEGKSVLFQAHPTCSQFVSCSTCVKATLSKLGADLGVPIPNYPCAWCASSGDHGVCADWTGMEPNELAATCWKQDALITSQGVCSTLPENVGGPSVIMDDDVDVTQSPRDLNDGMIAGVIFLVLFTFGVLIYVLSRVRFNWKLRQEEMAGVRYIPVVDGPVQLTTVPDR